MAFSFLDDQDPIPLLGEAERRDAAARKPEPMMIQS